MVVSVASPFPFFAGLDGRGLNAGTAYVGDVNTDPELLANRQSIWFDALMGTGATQPLRIVGGYIIDGSGAPANIYAADDFSLKVLDENGATVLYAPSYTARLLSASITFGTLIVSTGVRGAGVGTAFSGTLTNPWLSEVARQAQVRALSIYQGTQPAVAADFSRLSRLGLPLAKCIYRVAPTLSNLFNVASVTVLGVGDYSVNLTVPAPAGIVVCSATADTPVRQAIADIDVGRAFIHVTTFNTNTGAAAASGFHLIADFDATASVADPIA